MLFGTTGTSQALGPAGTTPLSIGVMRMVIGGTGLAILAFLLAARHARRRPVDSAPPPRLGIRSLALMVLTGVCLAIYQPLFFLGTSLNGVAVGTVVALGSAPILAGLLEWALTRRMPTPTWMGASSAGLCAFAVPVVDLAWLGPTSGLVMALWLGIATISIAYVLFTWGLSGLTAATAATLTLGEPLTASILGIVVLGERLSALAIVGLVVLGAGLALLAWGSRGPRDPQPYAVEA